MQSASNDSIHR